MDTDKEDRKLVSNLNKFISKVNPNEGLSITNETNREKMLQNFEDQSSIKQTADDDRHSQVSQPFKAVH